MPFKMTCTSKHTGCDDVVIKSACSKWLLRLTCACKCEHVIPYGIGEVSAYRPMIAVVLFLDSMLAVCKSL